MTVLRIIVLYLVIFKILFKERPFPRMIHGRGVRSRGTCRGGEDWEFDCAFWAFRKGSKGKIFVSTQMSDMDGAIKMFFKDDRIRATDGNWLGFGKLVEFIFEAEGKIIHDEAFGLDGKDAGERHTFGVGEDAMDISFF